MLLFKFNCLPVRKSKLSGWLRPSMMTCKVCTVVGNLSAVFSIPSFSSNEFIFCCISGLPISHSVPPTNDKNLQRKKKTPTLINNITYFPISLYRSLLIHLRSIYQSINWSLLKIYHVSHAIIDDVSWGKKREGITLGSCAIFQ